MESLAKNDTNVRNVAFTLLAEPRRLGLDPQLVRARLEQLPSVTGVRLELLSILAPDAPAVRDAWKQVEASLAAKEEVHLHPRVFLGLAYASTPSERLVAQALNDLRWLSRVGNKYFDHTFVDYLSRRIRADPEAAQALGRHVVDNRTPVERAALFGRLLSLAGPPNPDVVATLDERIGFAVLPPAPLVFDLTSQSVVPASALVMAVAEAALAR